jgi:hypothetical protein
MYKSDFYDQEFHLVQLPFTDTINFSKDFITVGNHLCY